MISILIQKLGARAQLAVSVLALVVGANVLLQMYMHKTTPLTAWKGGGFGMYTEPHGEDRSVWIEVEGQNGVGAIRLWPPTTEFSQWVSTAGPSGQAYINALQRSAERLRFFPKSQQSKELIARAARVRWPNSLIGDVIPSEGRVFAPTEIRLFVFENRYNLQAKKVERTIVSSVRGGGA
mgnify:CR=1 FL=1